jgi:hypothetical protein
MIKNIALLMVSLLSKMLPETYFSELKIPPLNQEELFLLKLFLEPEL